MARIKEYFVNRPEVAAVYLFGSHASGKERRGSDLDLGLLFAGDDRQLMLEARNQIMAELARITAKDIHPVILNGASQELLRQVFSKGICVVVNDTGVLARFVMVQFGLIADFAFYRRQMQDGLIRKVLGGGNVDRP